MTSELLSLCLSASSLKCMAARYSLETRPTVTQVFEAVTSELKQQRLPAEHADERESDVLRREAAHKPVEAFQRGRLVVVTQFPDIGENSLVEQELLQLVQSHRICSHTGEHRHTHR